jgi:hypothetical protein
MIHSPTIVIRLATAADASTLNNLAALDSRRALAGPAMLAEVDGNVRAALDLADGSVAADPFACRASSRTGRCASAPSSVCVIPAGRCRCVRDAARG